jgi:hypothetical protein
MSDQQELVRPRAQNASRGTGSRDREPLSSTDRDPLDRRARYCQQTENRGTQRDRRLMISARAAGVKV